jgi:hypothetical protein
MSRRRPRLALRRALPGLFAVLPLLLLWPALRHFVEARMLLHMLLEFPLLLASGWAVHHLSLRPGRTPWPMRGLALLDWRGWTGATLVNIVAAVWMVPAALDLALLSTPVAAAKTAGWWFTGWVLAGSLRRMDPELLLFLAGNLAWMMASAGLLYIDAPARLCVNYLQDDQQQTGIALVLAAVVLGALALRQLLRSAPELKPV